MLGTGFVEKYVKLSRSKDSFLCVGIDPAIKSMRKNFIIPQYLIESKETPKGIKEFCIHVIRSVGPYTPIIKPNAQFLMYILGFEDMKEIVNAIHEVNSLALLDIKLSDIGTTIDAGLYWINELGFDAVTFSPFPGYLNGVDAVYNWAKEKDKGIFALCRMSNPGTHDYQSRFMEGKKFYHRLASDAFNHGANGYVIGCTASEELGEIRKIIGEECLILAPGLGPQGGDPKTALRYGTNKEGERLIVSSSRSVNYAYENLKMDEEKFAEASAMYAKNKRDELNKIRDEITR